MPKDWGARFKLSDRKPWPKWPLILLIILLPINGFGHWWLRFGFFIVLIVLIYLVTLPSRSD